MNVLAIDPGGTTGMAHQCGPRFESWEVEGGLEGFAEYWLAAEQWQGYDFIVIERFTIMASTLRKTREYDALEIVGLVKATCHVHGPTLRLQTATQGKSFGTDAKLKALKWWDSSPGGHRNDAARHLVTFLAGHEPGFLEQLSEVMP